MKTPVLNVRMAAPKHVELEIYDDIGPAWAGMIDESVVASALKGAGEYSEITVRINSPGGSAYSGLAIFNLLRDQNVPVNIIVDGVAASAASLIAMAGTNVRIPKSALLMIHDPATLAWGGEEDLQNAINQLKAVKKASVAAYATKTGLSEDVIAQMMAEETWLTGEEAVSQKFADTLTAETAKSAKPAPQNALPVRYRRAPENFLNLVAMSAAAQPVSKESEMTTATLAAPPAETAAPVLETAASVPVATSATPPVAQVVDVNGQVQTAIANERKRVADITAMCNRAGCTDRAQNWINNGTSVSDVQNALFDVLCTNRPPVGGESAGGPIAATGDERFKQEYAASRDIYMQNGVTEEAYIKSRRIDMGLEILKVGQPAK